MNGRILIGAVKVTDIPISKRSGPETDLPRICL